ncbi:MFS transporter [bacterium]|nr:MFS transporter [bacterium]
MKINSMLARFSAYGFLKNQRYFEPFFILFLMDKGLNFTEIGLLVGFRELFINIMEIPSGGFADFYGRRRSMIVSFSSYIISFLIFGLSGPHIWLLFTAMFFFSIGEAFRTGTHKALIFTWLRIHNRLDEKVRIYGYTRSWSKLGSAFSIIIATYLVLREHNYSAVFFYTLIPYLLGLINFFFYPAELEGEKKKDVCISRLFSHVFRSMVLSVKRAGQRRLILESMCFEGFFKATKDYIQPMVKNFAIAIPVFVTLGKGSRTPVLIGLVYFVLYLLSAVGSRKSHSFVSAFKNEERGAAIIWKIASVLYILMIPFLAAKSYPAAILFFIGLYFLQNIWRPILISRFDKFATEEDGATVLSIESQAKSIAAMIFAPIAGMFIDLVRTRNIGGEFWPVAAVGAVLSIAMVVTKRNHRAE